jgi:hypothetical protein
MRRRDEQGRYSVYRRGLSPVDRFMSKVMPVPTGCWLWTGGVSKWGYGKFKVEGRTLAAHRWGYEALVGPVPEGLQIDHRCRVRSCVNPSHLDAVTCRENLLRGDTFQARNAAKTHCPKGHPYSGDNLMLSAGGRYCRTCTRARSARWRAENLDRARALEAASARRRRAERKAATA